MFKHFNKNFFFLLFFPGLILLSFLLKNYSFELDDKGMLISGIATFENYSIAKRVSIFYKSILLLTGSFVFFSFIFSFIKNLVQKHKLLFNSLNDLSIIGTGLVFFQLIGNQVEYSSIFLLAVSITIILFYLGNLRYNLNLLNSLNKSYLWIFTLSISIFFPIFELLLPHNRSRFGFTFLLVFIALTIFFKLFISACNYNPKEIFKYSIPIYLLPISSFFSEELFLILNQNNAYLGKPQTIYFLLIFFILFLSLFFIRLKKLNFDINNILQNYIYPSLLISISIFTLYTPIIDQPNDMFELANPANGIMRLFKFSEIPIINSFSSHVLSDFGLKPLYILLNGYSGTIDFIIYDFIIYSILLYIFYIFILKLTKSGLFAFVLCLFFPFLPSIFIGNHTLYLLTILLLFKSINSFTYKNLFFLGIWNTFLVLWRIDVGIASLGGTTMILLLYLLKIKFQKEKVFFLLKAILSISGLILMAAISFRFIMDVDIYGNFLKSLDYLKSSQAHGYTTLSHSKDRIYYYHYFIMPLITLFITFFFLNKNYTSKISKIKFIDFSVVALIGYYIFNLPRGLVRHSLLENNEVFTSSFFYLFFGIFIYSIFLKNRFSKAIFVGTIMFTFFSFTPTNTSSTQSIFDKFGAKLSTKSILPDIKTKISRVKGFEKFKKAHFFEFKQFLDINFPDSATFIDLSNTPMLYFYTNRQVPSYFNQYMQNTVTPFLQEKNLELLTLMNVPVAVFSNWPNSWWDNTDNVPNTIRYNLITKYIYKNYKPYTVLNNHYIWIKKDMNLPKSQFTIDSNIINKPYNYNLKLYPYLLGKRVNPPKKDICHPIAIIEDRNEINIKFPIIINPFNYYLAIEINSFYTKSNISIEYFHETEFLGSYKFSTKESENINKYSIPLSSQYNWINLKPNNIKIKTSDKFKIKTETIRLFEGEHY